MTLELKSRNYGHHRIIVLFKSIRNSKRRNIEILRRNLIET